MAIHSEWHCQNSAFNGRFTQTKHMKWQPSLFKRLQARPSPGLFPIVLDIHPLSWTQTMIPWGNFFFSQVWKRLLFKVRWRLPFIGNDTRHDCAPLPICYWLIEHKLPPKCVEEAIKFHYLCPHIQLQASSTTLFDGEWRVGAADKMLKPASTGSNAHGWSDSDFFSMKSVLLTLHSCCSSWC